MVRAKIPITIICRDVVDQDLARRMDVALAGNFVNKGAEVSDGPIFQDI